jgi:hypothetical protein
MIISHARTEILALFPQGDLTLRHPGLPDHVALVVLFNEVDIRQVPPCGRGKVATPYKAQDGFLPPAYVLKSSTFVICWLNSRFLAEVIF